MTLTSDKSKSVSYTHLDVYKRQALNREKSQLESTIETLNTIVSQLKSDYANMSEKYNASQQELNDVRS